MAYGLPLQGLSMSEHGFPHADAKPLRQCPQCTALIEGEAESCRVCGCELAHHSSLPVDPDDQVLHESLFASAEPIGPEMPSLLPADVPVPPKAQHAMIPRPPLRARESHPVQKWSVPMIGVGGFLAAVTAVLAFGWLHAQAPETTAVPQTAAAPAHPAPIVQAPPPQKWAGRRQAQWASDGSKMVAFELEANQDVPVWMASARPQLVVRCVSRMTEVYMALGTPASVEQQAGNHTVRLQIDDDPEVQQQWTDSESSHELFSPDGPALTRRLAGAQHLKFGFTPFNAKPVVAEFSVRGFDELAPLVASTCGWRIDESPVSRAPRSARLR